MLTFAFNKSHLKNASVQARRSSIVWAIWFAGFIGLTGLVGLLIYRGGVSPNAIAWLIYLIGAGAIVYQPRYGLYLVTFFALAGDTLLIYWYPFAKNFSSSESVLYLHDSLIVSPLETYLGLIILSWLGRETLQRKFKLYRGELFWPAMLFLLFITGGLVYGIGTGGDVTVGLWEARPIFYLPVILVLTSNLLTRREHVHQLMWAVIIALFIEGLVGVYTYFWVLEADLSLVETITEHSAAIHMNAVFVYAVGVWLYKGRWRKRLLMLVLIPPIMLTYLAAQRRAAFVVLIIALILIVFVLFKENRKAFWLIVPPLAMVGIVYVGAFWNSDGALAMPVQAIKSVVAQDQANAKDQASNIYRLIENVNSSFTIHQKPLTGVGFGQKFYFLVPLPDISFFVWWEYITHNSIVWIWMKTGIGGFVSMLYLIGTAVIVGVGVLWRMPSNELSAIALTAVLYIIMHFFYAYVDMSWDTQSMIFVGIAMGMINSLVRIVERPVPFDRKRWPWQPDPMPVPELKPLPFE